MHKRTDSKTFARAKQLHRKLTPADVKLWARLRANRLEGVHFRNQHAIEKYIVDFCAPRKKLIIEIDGRHHIDQEDYDKERTLFLESKGCTILRFWNNDVMNDMEGVLRAIILALKSDS